MDTPAEAGDVTTTTATSTKSLASPKEVRAWARKRGIPVGTRGHIAKDVIKQFNRTHRKRATSKNPWEGNR